MLREILRVLEEWFGSFPKDMRRFWESVVTRGGGIFCDEESFRYREISAEPNPFSQMNCSKEYFGLLIYDSKSIDPPLREC